MPVILEKSSWYDRQSLVGSHQVVHDLVSVQIEQPGSELVLVPREAADRQPGPKRKTNSNSVDNLLDRAHPALSLG